MNEQNEADAAPENGRRWPWWLGGLLLVVLAGLILLPHGIRYGLRQALLANGAEQAHIENIDFNPFIGELMLDELEVDVGAERPLVIPRARAYIQWLPLLQKRVVIQGITIEYTRLAIERDAAGTWHVGGLVLREAPPEQAPGASPWEFAISSLKIRSSEVHYRTPRLEGRLQIEAASLMELRSWRQAPAARLKLQGSINGSPLYLEAAVAPFAEQPQLKAQLRLTDLALAPFATLAGPDLQTLEGRLGLDLALEATQGTEGLRLRPQGKVVLDQLRLGLEQIELSEARLAWTGDIDASLSPQQQLTLQAAGELDLERLGVRQEATVLDCGSRRWEGSLQFAQEAAGSRLGLSGRLTVADLRLTQPSLRLNDAGLDWEGELAWAATQDAGRTLRAEGRLALAAVEAVTDTLAVRDEQTRWQGKVSLVSKTDSDTPQLHLDGLLESAGAVLDLAQAERPLLLRHAGLRWEGQLDHGVEEQGGDLGMEASAEVQGLVVQDPNQRLDLLAVQRLAAPRIRLQGLGDVQIGGLALEDVVIARADEAPAGPDAQTLFRARAVSADPIGLRDGRALEIEQVVLTDVDAFIRRQADGSLYLIERLQKPGEAPETEGGEAAVGASAEEAASAPTVRIDEIALADGGVLRFEDEAVTPPFHQTLRLEQLQVSQIDTGKPQQPARFLLNGGVGKYSRLSAQGSVVPLAPRLTLDVEAKVESFELNPLSSYTAPVLGYNLAAGTLNTDSTIRIENGVIDGHNKLVINNVTVTPQDEARMQQLNAELNMPLDAALSMLRDSNNDIHLELPVSGDVADPRFELGDVINTALGNAMKKGAISYLKLALQPYGAIITLVQIAGEAASRVSLDPVGFAAAASTLGDESRHYLERIAALMKERPQLRLRLCGMATEADRARFIEQATERQRQAAAAQAKAPAATAPPPIGIPDEQLRELAKARADQVKDHLVGQHAIEPQRLFVCLPELDQTAEAAPRVMLQI